jgi:hypothetical protein
VWSVFVAGSRQISRLPAEVGHRLDTMIEKGVQILVGDANGADKAVQRYLADRSHPNVLVHCMKDHCRNNVGNCPTRQLVSPRGAKGFEYYSVKDRAMVDTAEYGLTLWDAESKGTLNSVINLVRQGKPVVVYLAPRESFRNVRSLARPPAIVERVRPGRCHAVRARNWKSRTSLNEPPTLID